MIEEAQDQIVTLMETYLAANLTALASPSGGEAITLTAPNKYLINFDPESSIIPQNMMPACIQIPGSSTSMDWLKSGPYVTWEHRIALVFLLELVSTKADALTAVETLQRQRSRYAEAAMKVLWVYHNTGVLTSVDLEKIQYSQVLGNAEQTRFMGSVWLYLNVREDETL